MDQHDHLALGRLVEGVLDVPAAQVVNSCSVCLLLASLVSVSACCYGLSAGLDRHAVCSQQLRPQLTGCQVQDFAGTGQCLITDGAWTCLYMMSRDSPLGVV